MQMAGDTGHSKRWEFSSEMGQEKQVVKELAAALQKDRLPEHRLDEMKTAISEACLNAMEHGNHFDKSLRVSVVMEVQCSCYLFRICDQGDGYDPDEARPALMVRDKIDWEEPRGWGLQYMREFADRVDAYKRDDCFCVELQFARERVKELKEE